MFSTFINLTFVLVKYREKLIRLPGFNILIIIKIFIISGILLDFYALEKCIMFFLNEHSTFNRELITQTGEEVIRKKGG